MRMGKEIHPEDWLLKPGSQLDPLESTVSEWVMNGTSRLEYHPKTRMGPVPIGVHAPQWSCHVEKRASKVLLRITIGDGWVGPWTPNCVDPFRVLWIRYPKGCRTSLQGEHVVAPSIPLHRQQDECMRELHQKPTRHMTKAGLWSKTETARPSSRSQRCSCGHSTSQTWSPSASPWGWSQPTN